MEDATSSTSRATTILMTSVGVQCCVRVSRGVGDKLVDIGEIQEKFRETVRSVLLVETRPPFTLCPQRTSHHNAVSLVMVVNPDCNRV